MRKIPCNHSTLHSVLRQNLGVFYGYVFPAPDALQRHNTENSKQIFPEKELSGLSPDFHIHVSVSDLYIPTIGLAFLLQGNMLIDPGNIYE